MIILRPVERRDTLTLARLSQVMEEGLTSLPRRPMDLEKRIGHSINSFASKESVDEAIYLFILEDLETKNLIGTSQIIADTLGSTLGYYYREESYTQSANRLQDQTVIPYLRPIRHLEKASELGGLFLHPSARQKGLSQLLSLGRLLFIAAYPERFKKMIIAEMRGVTSKEGSSAFWEGIGRKFLNIQFDELMRQIALDPLFIHDVIPPFPICLSMLAPEVQQLVGKNHPESEVAIQRLIGQGFHYTGEMDIFDGGPKMGAEIASLSVIQHTLAARAVCGPLPLTSPSILVLLANHHPQFRACKCSISIQSPETIVIDPETAQALEINTGELVHYTLLHKAGPK